MMAADLADINVVKQVRLLVQLWESPEWKEIWTQLGMAVRTFQDLQLPLDLSDAELWRTCQERRIILITGNRNEHDAESLEATIREHNTPDSLLVFTIADIEKMRKSRNYAKRVEDVKQMQNEKCKVKNAKFKDKNTFTAGGIRRSGKAIFGKS
jgi:hypothetical protein